MFFLLIDVWPIRCRLTQFRFAKMRFPSLQERIKTLLTAEIARVDREDKFLKEVPERLENALRRCKKLTGTLVTLKRLV